MQKDLDLFPIEKVMTTKLLEELVKNIGVISDDRVRFFYYQTEYRRIGYRLKPIICSQSCFNKKRGCPKRNGQP